MRSFVKPVLVISACLDLQPVRYNGQVVKDELALKLREYCQTIAVCPEVSIGLGVPRDRVIVYMDKEPRLFQPSTGRDLTQEMLLFSESFLSSLPEVDGFLLKSKSPSCGISGTLVYKDPYAKEFYKRGKGLFAMRVLEKFELLPVEDEGRLKNPEIRDHFLTRLFAVAHLRSALSKVDSVMQLMEFHRQYKYLLMAHSQVKLKEMGRLVANSKGNLQESVKMYRLLFMQALKRRPSRKQHANVLLHMFGHLSRHINQKEKSHFVSLVEKFKQGKRDLYTLTDIIKSFAYRFEESYLLEQAYLEPYPEELKDAIINN
ncbi:MAG: DUF523 and DUF1722 domain-containing protein [Hydrogenobacter thermophilus]|uniref:YbgA family protein n=1 Tax=Hydrogenobacter thermophilus TaxID=940 RepID=UPI001C76B4B9|nr:DUF523 and DUF1722 domain-containing protein [Hydrogenobacter thermophilus]QWK19701.1 MAG: DUF523 and DUF1722 domain-containing protein [Hydrogenobacter thermophilus]